MKPATLDLKKLRAFQLVAKNGSLRIAAARLDQTVPAVSAKLRRLEEDLGVELFERLPNKLVLTPAGEQFVEQADAVLERAEEAIAAVTSSAGPSGRLSVSLGSDHSWYFAPKISNFVKRYPGVKLRLDIYRAADALRALGRGELDACVGVFPKLPKTLAREIIAESTLSLVCTPGHPLLARPSPRPADISRYRLILLPKYAPSRKNVDLAIAGNLNPDNVLEVANCHTASAFVEKGVGVAIVHSLCIEHFRPANLRWVELGNQFGQVAFSVVYRRGRVSSALIQGLLRELRD
ncbi:MAG: LysR family transcriptional regulator [Bradyrhizobium sp.]